MGLPSDSAMSDVFTNAVAGVSTAYLVASQLDVGVANSRVGFYRTGLETFIAIDGRPETVELLVPVGSNGFFER